MMTDSLWNTLCAKSSSNAARPLQRISSQIHTLPAVPPFMVPILLFLFELPSHECLDLRILFGFLYSESLKWQVRVSQHHRDLDCDRVVIAGKGEGTLVAGLANRPVCIGFFLRWWLFLGLCQSLNLSLPLIFFKPQHLWFFLFFFYKA